MKSKFIRVFILSMVAGGFVSGCVVDPYGRVAFRPLVVVAPAPVYAAPPTVVVTSAMVPDSYAWDGYEYVGLVGDQYYYLGPGNVWLFCEPFRLERFHGWEGVHPDWRDHAVRNDSYRTDHFGHVQPRRDVSQGKDRKDGH
jgi:hypothetical protein